MFRLAWWMSRFGLSDQAVVAAATKIIMYRCGRFYSTQEVTIA